MPVAAWMGGAAAAWIGAAGNSHGQPCPEARLERLVRVHGKGLITDAEYARKRAEIVALL